MPSKVEFHFDFGSPNAYFVHKLDPAIEQRTGAKFTYVPVLLGGVFKLTNNQAPMVQFKGIKNKLEYQRLEIIRFIKKHGLTAFKMNPHFPVNTVQIMRGAAAAEMDGGLAPYVDAVFRCMWEEGRKMDDPEVIRAALDQSGLDGARVLARIQDQEVKEGCSRTRKPRWRAARSARPRSSSGTRSSSARTACARSRRRSWPRPPGDEAAFSLSPFSFSVGRGNPVEHTMRRRQLFADRAEAGRLLAEPLVAMRLSHPLVLALPRGGVPVGAEIARRLQRAAGYRVRAQARRAGAARARGRRRRRWVRSGDRAQRRAGGEARPLRGLHRRGSQARAGGHRAPPTGVGRRCGRRSISRTGR